MSTYMQEVLENAATYSKIEQLVEGRMNQKGELMRLLGIKPSSRTRNTWILSAIQREESVDPNILDVHDWQIRNHLRHFFRNWLELARDSGWFDCSAEYVHEASYPIWDCDYLGKRQGKWVRYLQHINIIASTQELQLVGAYPGDEFDLENSWLVADIEKWVQMADSFGHLKAEPVESYKEVLPDEQLIELWLALHPTEYSRLKWLEFHYDCLRYNTDPEIEDDPRWDYRPQKDKPTFTRMKKHLSEAKRELDALLSLRPAMIAEGQKAQEVEA